ncbi:MAG: hypothetical protein ACREA9_26590 [Pyrinomonadaceae bacterium]
MIPQSIPRFAHEPRTEQEVVCLFGALLEYLDIPLVIDQVRTPFPDCLTRNAESGQPIRIEFELYGHHFIQHRHPLDGCDMMVCWIDDWCQWPDTLCVVQLRDVVRTKCPSLIDYFTDREPRTPWHEDSFMQECLTNGLSEDHLRTIRSILRFAESHNLGPEWLKDPKGSFAVRDRDQFFKVYTDGWLGFPFSRLHAGDSFPKLARDLNDAFCKELIVVTDSTRKGIGGDVAELFPTADRLAKFLGVWESFANQRR